MTERFTNETLGVRSNLHPRINYSRSENSSSASAAHLVHLQNLCRAYITTHSKYHGHWWKHNTDNPASTPVTFFIPFFYFFFLFRYPLKTSDEQDKHLKLALSESGAVHSPKGLFPSRIPPPNIGGADVRQEVQNKFL